MAFGQQSGPPATARQLNELLALLQAAGYPDFRSARGPLGFTQRQGGGKFTRDEADAVIADLQREAEVAEGNVAEGSVADGADAAPGAPALAPTVAAVVAPSRPVPPLTDAQRALRRVPTDQLAAELQRRGWIVVEP